jgi:hypothetical protein
MKKVITTIAASFTLLSIASAQTTPHNDSILIWSGRDSIVNWRGLSDLEYSFFHQDTILIRSERGGVVEIHIVLKEQSEKEGVKRVREFRCK